LLLLLLLSLLLPVLDKVGKALRNGTLADRVADDV
jgi:hypothetical protein